MTVLEEAKEVGLTVTKVEVITGRDRKLLGRLLKAHPRLLRVLMIGCKAVVNERKVTIDGDKYVKQEG